MYGFVSLSRAISCDQHRHRCRSCGCRLPCVDPLRGYFLSRARRIVAVYMIFLIAGSMGGGVLAGFSVIFLRFDNSDFAAGSQFAALAVLSACVTIGLGGVPGPTKTPASVYVTAKQRFCGSRCGCFNRTATVRTATSCRCSACAASCVQTARANRVDRRGRSCNPGRSSIVGVDRTQG